ncbi:hypothetical protein KR026_005644 [Drosophila bipectinata]|nr:hypothetical protein KR026_005644 [Drosophila bipectinata]
MEGLPLLMLIVYSILAHTTPHTWARSCSRPAVGLKSNNIADIEETQIDLSQLSGKQLKQLVQQLAKFQTQKDIEEDDEDGEEEEQSLEEDYEDHRGSSRPWNKVQRIIRRQLVKIPKRYLKKLLRQFGLARSSGGGIGSVRSGGDLRIPLEEYYLIPLE